MQHATCERCGEQFRRRTRKHRFCSVDCQQRAAGRRRNRAKGVAPATCSIAGCDKPRRSFTSAWCEMHYGRWRRNGDPELLIAPKMVYAHHLGYVKVRAQDHPLADPRHIAYEHRVVMYDHAGSGTQACVWCGAELEWGADLHVDHLNHDRADNRLSNLVVSCRPCNTGRKAKDDPERWAQLSAERQVLVVHDDEVAETKARLLRQLTATEQPGGWNA